MKEYQQHINRLAAEMFGEPIGQQRMSEGEMQALALLTIATVLGDIERHLDLHFNGA